MWPNFRTEKDRFLLDVCRGKRVLDVGCINHTLEAARLADWRHAQLKTVANVLVGLDYAKDAVAQLNLEGWRIVAADCQCFDIREEFPGGFDVVLASEVIEHLVDPGSFLRSAARHLSPGGRIVLTTPNATGFGFFLEILAWGEERINDDHTMTFSRKNMATLVGKSGLQIEQFHWLIQDTTRLHQHGGLTTQVLAKTFFWLQCLASSVRPAFSKEMIVVLRQAAAPT